MCNAESYMGITYEGESYMGLTHVRLSLIYFRHRLVSSRALKSWLVPTPHCGSCRRRKKHFIFFLADYSDGPSKYSLVQVFDDQRAQNMTRNNISDTLKNLKEYMCLLRGCVEVKLQCKNVIVCLCRYHYESRIYLIAFRRSLPNIYVLLF